MFKGTRRIFRGKWLILRDVIMKIFSFGIRTIHPRLWNDHLLNTHIYVYILSLHKFFMRTKITYYEQCRTICYFQRVPVLIGDITEMSLTKINTDVALEEKSNLFKLIQNLCEKWIEILWISILLIFKINSAYIPLVNFWGYEILSGSVRWQFRKRSLELKRSIKPETSKLLLILIV